MGNFGEFLKEYRKQNNLSISELHRITGVSQPYLSQLEGGKTPSVKIIQRIAEGLTDDIDNPTTYDMMYNELLKHAGYLEVERMEVNTEAQKYFFDEIDTVLDMLTTNNEFIDLISEDVKALEKKYYDNLEINEVISPTWLKEIAKKSEYDSEWVYDLIGDLKEITKKYNLQCELQSFLLKEGITYKGYPITDNDKKLIGSYLDILFKDKTK